MAVKSVPCAPNRAMDCRANVHPFNAQIRFGHIILKDVNCVWYVHDSAKYERAQRNNAIIGKLNTRKTVVSTVQNA